MSFGRRKRSLHLTISIGMANVLPGDESASLLRRAGQSLRTSTAAVPLYVLCLKMEGVTQLAEDHGLPIAELVLDEVDTSYAVLRSSGSAGLYQSCPRWLASAAAFPHVRSATIEDGSAAICRDYPMVSLRAVR